MLEVVGLHAGYGAVEVLRGIDLRLGAGEIVALLGANGAGKSTLNNTISGLLRPLAGMIRFDGRDITGAPSPVIVAQGLIQVPEGRRIFPNLTVRENLELGSYRRARPRRAVNIERALRLFPRLKERFGQRAGTLSGGEQQMLAIGRGLMAEPRLLILDEPSLGLAPLVVRQIFGAIRDLNRRTGLTVLLVEQNAFQALRLAHRGYVLVNGAITMTGGGAELLARPEIRAAYLEGAHA